jgi:hypothetical protein
VSLDPILFIDFWKLFVNMCNGISFAGIQIHFGPTDQKLWMFENLRRSLVRAGMCWSQQARIDYISPKR